MKRFIHKRHCLTTGPEAFKKEKAVLRSFTAFLLSLTLLVATPLSAAQPSHDWQHAIGQLRPGDHLRLSLKTGPIDGLFTSSTAQDITVDSTTTPKEAVLKIQRYGAMAAHPAKRRARNAAIGAAIGFGAGFAIGKIGTRCTGPGDWFCGSSFSSEAGFVVGGVGMFIGAAVGAFLPQRHAKETVYSFK